MRLSHGRALTLRRGTAGSLDPGATDALRELRDSLLQLRQSAERNRSSMSESLRDLRTESGNAQRGQRDELPAALLKQRRELADTLREQDARLEARLGGLQDAFSKQRLELTASLATQRRQSAESLNGIQRSVHDRLQAMQAHGSPAHGRPT